MNGATSRSHTAITLRMRRTWALAGLMLGAISGPAHADPPAHAEPIGWQLAAAGGHIGGIAPGADVTGTSLRLGLERRFFAALGAGPELAGLAFTGTRDGARVSARGVAVTYVLRWHAVRRGASSMFFELGWGGALFATRFPPGGTHANGTSMIGAGLQLELGWRIALRVEAREVHVSNGKGIVPENPAFDGLELGAHVARWL